MDKCWHWYAHLKVVVEHAVAVAVSSAGQPDDAAVAARGGGGAGAEGGGAGGVQGRRGVHGRVADRRVVVAGGGGGGGGDVHLVGGVVLGPELRWKDCVSGGHEVHYHHQVQIRTVLLVG